MQTVNLDAWESETKREAISVELLDQLMKEYELARTRYEETKEISDEAYKLAENRKAELIDLLERAGKRNWAVDGIGKVSVSEKMTIRVPQDLMKKKDMLSFFRTLGEDRYLSMVSVNHMTLNAFYKQETEADPNFRIPGCEDGAVEKTLRLNRTKR
jgi:hypothetical protein